MGHFLHFLSFFTKKFVIFFFFVIFLVAVEWTACDFYMDYSLTATVFCHLKYTYLSNNKDECVVNTSEATPQRCSILEVFSGISGKSTEVGGTHAIE